MKHFRPISTRVSCVPLYAITESNTVEFLGSGTLVLFQGRPILATAAHVVDNGKKFILLLCGAETPVRLTRPCLCTPVRNGMTRQTDPLDLCVIPLTQEEAVAIYERCQFIDWKKDAVLDVPPNCYPHKIMGYPEINNIPTEHQNTLPANILRIDVFEDHKLIRHAGMLEYKKHPRWYIGLKYDPSIIEKQAAKPKVDTIHGFSGGSIWRTDGTRMIGFAGIVTESLPPSRNGQRIIYGLRAPLMNDILVKLQADGNL